MAYYWTPTKLNGSRNWMAHQIEWLTKMTGSPNWIAHQSEWLTKLNGSLSNWMTHHWKARKTEWVTIEWLTVLNGSPYWMAHRTEWLTIKWKAGSNARSLVHTRRQPPAPTTISSARINFGWHWNFLTSPTFFFLDKSIENTMFSFSRMKCTLNSCVKNNCCMLDRNGNGRNVFTCGKN